MFRQMADKCSSETSASPDDSSTFLLCFFFTQLQIVRQRNRRFKIIFCKISFLDVVREYTKKVIENAKG